MKNIRHSYVLQLLFFIDKLVKPGKINICEFINNIISQLLLGVHPINNTGWIDSKNPFCINLNCLVRNKISRFITKTCIDRVIILKSKLIFYIL